MDTLGRVCFALLPSIQEAIETVEGSDGWSAVKKHAFVMYDAERMFNLALPPHLDFDIYKADISKLVMRLVELYNEFGLFDARDSIEEVVH